MKILVWNIKFFSLSRIKGRALPAFGPRFDDASRAFASMMYITLTVKKSKADIFVVLEPRASAGNPGTLVDSGSGGPSGLIELLSRLRALDDNWFLVPPQRINSTRQDPIDKGSQYTECIGIFWRDNAVNFTGPWANTAQGILPASEANPAVAYGDSWKKVVPDNLTAAGRCRFVTTASDGSNKLVEAGFPEATSRRPFLTRFTEVGGMGRTLDLFTVHNETADPGRATDALDKLPFSDDAKRITLLAGDFNIDLSAPTVMESTSLATLANRFVKLWPPGTPRLGQGNLYPPTLVKTITTATPAAYNNTQCLDYAFLHYADGATPAFDPSIAIVDRVAGAPNPPFDTDMLDPLNTYAAMDGGGVDVFRRRANYGHIGTPTKLDDATAPIADGTSDHLPILLEV